MPTHYKGVSKAKVVDQNVEGRQEPKETIRSKGRVGGKKGAGHVGAANVNHV